MVRPGQGAGLEREQTRAGTDGGQRLQIMALAALPVEALVPHNPVTCTQCSMAFQQLVEVMEAVALQIFCCSRGKPNLPVP